MRVAIAGGHGQIALRLTRLLSERGDEILSLIRNPDHAGDVRAAGGEPVVCDLESACNEEVADAVDGADAVVFAAGAGPGSGSDRKLTMDYSGAAKLIAAAKARAIRRYVMVSSMGANPDLEGDDTFAVYLRAKGRADRELQQSGLDFTIVRPGRLTDDPGSGRVALGENVGRGQVSRDDVAAVLAAVLGSPGRSAGHWRSPRATRPWTRPSAVERRHAQAWRSTTRANAAPAGPRAARRRRAPWPLIAHRAARRLAGARRSEAELDAGEEELAALRQLPQFGFPGVRLVF